MSAPHTRWLTLCRKHGASAPSLDLSTGGTFARALAAYRYKSAPTDGSVAFLESVGSGTRRHNDTRGDGIGASLLMEKAATNYVLRSRDLANAAWTTGTGSIVTANQNGGPLADGLADEQAFTPNEFGQYQISPGPSGQIMASEWVRAKTGTGGNFIYAIHSSGTLSLKANGMATSTTYARNEVGGIATTNSGMLVADGRNLSGLGVTVTGTDFHAHAEDDYIDLVQLEAGYYPTSPIDTAGTSVTRPADTLSYASGAYPIGFITNGVVIVFAPDASSAEIVSAGETWVLAEIATGGMGGSGDTVRFRASKGALVADLLCGGAVKGSLTLTFSRGQALTITAKPSAGTLTVAGATTGNGTNGGSGAAWTSSQSLYVGGDETGASNVTGRFAGARIVEAV